MTETVLYGERVAACGCWGIPEGHHVPGCPSSATPPAPLCDLCGYRARTEDGCCGTCGEPRDGAEPPGRRSAPYAGKNGEQLQLDGDAERDE